MTYGRRSSSIFDAFTVSPLPYPVLLILAVILFYFGISWHFSYEEAVESVEEQFNWVLLATPIVLLLIVRWLSSMENQDMFFNMSPWDKRQKTYRRPSEGSSPWGVAALIVLLLILMQYQSTFLDSWFG